jgi:hypothetical protein
MYLVNIIFINIITAVISYTSVVSIISNAKFQKLDMFKLQNVRNEMCLKKLKTVSNAQNNRRAYSCSEYSETFRLGIRFKLTNVRQIR